MSARYCSKPRTFSSSPTTSGFNEPGSTVGFFPPGLAMGMSPPGALRFWWATTSSSAQTPVGCWVPSASSSESAADTTMRMRDIGFPFVGLLVDGAPATCLACIKKAVAPIGNPWTTHARIAPMATHNLEHLRTFLTVYRVGSLTEAARMLGISQPTASTHVHSLEQSLGLRLFERDPRGVSPTTKADGLARDVAPHIDALDDLAFMSLRSGGNESIHL